jgi:hypothetical protein
MADLDEIMSGAPSRAGNAATGGEGQPEPKQTQDAPAEPAQGQQPAEGAPLQEGEKDPVSGLKAALDDERGKRRLYKEHLDAVQHRLASMEGQVQTLLQQLQAQQRPQQPQQPATPPDWWQDPDVALDYRLRNAVGPVAEQLQQQVRKVEEAMQRQREEYSRIAASQQHGAETVDGAYQALAEHVRSNPAAAEHDWRRIMSSPHPYDALVQWNIERRALADFGRDPNAYREKLRQELLAELQQQQQPAQATGGQAPPQRATPSNFANTRSAGSRGAPRTDGPTPLSQIMGR